mgnify:CR=1 FL=1
MSETTGYCLSKSNEKKTPNYVTLIVRLYASCFCLDFASQESFDMIKASEMMDSASNKHGEELFKKLIGGLENNTCGSNKEYRNFIWQKFDKFANDVDRILEDITSKAAAEKQDAAIQKLSEELSSLKNKNSTWDNKNKNDWTKTNDWNKNGDKKAQPERRADNYADTRYARDYVEGADNGGNPYSKISCKAYSDKGCSFHKKFGKACGYKHTATAKDQSSSSSPAASDEPPAKKPKVD